MPRAVVLSDLPQDIRLSWHRSIIVLMEAVSGQIAVAVEAKEAEL